MLEIKRSRLSKLRRSQQASRAGRALRNSLVAFGILLLLAVAAGVVYTWYMSQQPLPETATQPAASPTAPVKPQQRTINPEAPVGVVLQFITSPLKPPANASINIKTTGGAACRIDVKYNDVAAQDTGLVPKIADEFGLVQWSWSIPAGTPVGKWPVEVTCANQKNSGYYKATLELVEQMP